MKEIKGIHVLGVFIFAFSVIIAVNITLAVNAVRTFPGLEVKNSYVASQKFEDARAVQEALNWEVSARLVGAQLELTIIQDGTPIAPTIEQAIFGRATSVGEDQEPEFTYADGVFLAPVLAGPGNWNLRLKAAAADGSKFEQRIIVRSSS